MKMEFVSKVSIVYDNSVPFLISFFYTLGDDRNSRSKEGLDKVGKF